MALTFESKSVDFDYEGFEFGPEDVKQLLFTVKTVKTDNFMVETNKGAARRVACAICGEVGTKEVPMDFRFMPNPGDFEVDDMGFDSWSTRE